MAGGLFALGVALAVWAIVNIRKAGTQFDIHKPTTAIVETGPYRFTRNPIYLGMFLGQTGIAIGFDSLWVLAMLVPFISSFATAQSPAKKPTLSANSALSIAATNRAFAAGYKRGAEAPFPCQTSGKREKADFG